MQQICNFCSPKLKKQQLGSDLFSYCRKCGRITSIREEMTSHVHEHPVTACV
ncbi:hypothetical protein [uncultured Methanomethylovorans sp.]|uniref:hypothetical protein n=1 Tax=uncultured Methanomethylovorans sp. TaxID=183759 RepID=UPI0026337BC9|nr:hypothetical protein [uncultured Methanomethylovorans sp.]